MADNSSHSTSVPGPANGVTRRVPDRSSSHSSSSEANKAAQDASTSASGGHFKRDFSKRYRHVEAVHSRSRPSCLSHDTVETPSFIGFRNLMVIVLGEFLISLSLRPIFVTLTGG